MIFGPTAIADAAGAILAHTIRLDGMVVRKGCVLGPAELAALRKSGHATVVAARLEPSDMAEDEAAHAVATRLVAPGLTVQRPGTGRANLVASVAGLFRADTTRIDALNAIHEGLTLATLPDAARVHPGETVATVKIIPFALPRQAIDTALARIAFVSPLRVAPFAPLRAGLVLTQLPGLKPSILQGAAAVTGARIAALSGTMLAPRAVAHEAEAVAAALAGLLEEGAELLLVSGASAVVDRRDVGPAGIVAAGGKILHLGMPVDPGNLLCLGEIGTVPAIVLPGCARSPKPNGIDLVLARLFAGEAAGSREIMAMGVGGLLSGYAPARRAAIQAASHPVWADHADGDDGTASDD